MVCTYFVLHTCSILSILYNQCLKNLLYLNVQCIVFILWIVHNSFLWCPFFAKKGKCKMCLNWCHIYLCNKLRYLPTFSSFEPFSCKATIFLRVNSAEFLSVALHSSLREFQKMNPSPKKVFIPMFLWTELTWILLAYFKEHQCSFGLLQAWASCGVAIGFVNRPFF